MHILQSHRPQQSGVSLVTVIFSGLPSAVDVMRVGVTDSVSGRCPAVPVSSPLKCQASSVLRCTTVYLLPLLSTPLIDAICAVITPLVIKQQFSPCFGLSAMTSQ